MNSSFFPPTFVVFVIVFSIKMLLEKNPIDYNITLYLKLNVVAILVASMSSKISIS